MKDKIKTTSFWLGVGGAIVILIDCISSIFGFSIAPDVVENIIISVCSILVLLGVITKKSVNDKGERSKEDLLQEIKNNSLDDDKID